MATIFKKESEHQPMGEYRPTPLDERKAKADILVKYANGGSYTVSSKIVISGRGVKGDCGQGIYEITENRLNLLRKKYNIECDF